jgi:hypothetical protein
MSTSPEARNTAISTEAQTPQEQMLALVGEMQDRMAALTQEFSTRAAEIMGSVGSVATEATVAEQPQQEPHIRLVSSTDERSSARPATVNVTGAPVSWFGRRDSSAVRSGDTAVQEPGGSVSASRRGGGGDGGNGGDGGGRGEGGRGWGWKRKAAAVAVVALAAVGISKANFDCSGDDESAGGGERAASTYDKLPAKFKLDNSVHTVNEGVKELRFKTSVGAMKTILGNPNEYNNLRNSNVDNKQVALKDYRKNMSTANAAEAFALGVVNSSAYSADVMNAFEGKDGETPRKDTHEERIAKIDKIVNQEKDDKHNTTKFNGHFRMNGPWDNSHTKRETKQLGSETSTHNNVRAFQIIPGNKKYDAVYIKIGGGNDGNEIACMNVNRNKNAIKLVAKKGPDGRITFAPPADTPNPSGEGNPTGDNPNPTGDGNPTGDTPEQEKTGPKNDKNREAAGNDGQDGGDPAGTLEPARPVAGPAPANIGQPQLPLPAPVTEAPDTRPAGAPAVEAPDPGVTGPAQQGNPGTTTPAQPINNGTQPAGE